MYGNEGATAVCERPCRARAALVSNQGKSLAIRVGDELWARLPVRTELFERGDDVAAKVTRYVDRTVRRTHPGLAIGTGFDKTWYAVVSEKVVAISQGRSYFTWEIRTGLAARVLSRYVARTEYGIGLGCPSTMQLAIQEAGLGRILLASAAGAAGKVLKRKGDFYRVAGNRVNTIDGPTPYSAYPSNVSAKLPPKDPARVAQQVSAAIRATLPAVVAATFGGTVVIDANDLGREVLGQDTDRADAFFTELFADNPLGQGRQQTPVAVCFQL